MVKRIKRIKPMITDLNKIVRKVHEYQHGIGNKKVLEKDFKKVYAKIESLMDDLEKIIYKNKYL